MVADAKRKEARKRRFGELASRLATIPKASATDTEPASDEFLKEKLVKKESTGVHGLKKSENQVESIPQSLEPGDKKVGESVIEKASDIVIQKPQRFIVFIGNLPYTATDESIGKHFAKIQPEFIRHRTKRDDGKSKGFAFLEFEGYDRMKTCLSLYHGSSFDDNISPARKLNVELTSGGGGRKSKERKDKLRSKNERLNEQRARRTREELRKKRILKDHDQDKQWKSPDAVNGTGHKKHYEPPRARGPSENGEIHPSRRSRLMVST